jgi:superfamily II RNA helicase
VQTVWSQFTQSLESILNGIAFHHAGLTPPDLRKVEKSFLAGDIRVLLSTSTLAMGVWNKLVALLNQFQGQPSSVSCGSEIHPILSRWAICNVS